MSTRAERQRLYFFWDYDLDEQELRAILSGTDEASITWAMTRLLEAAHWDDIWKYVGLRQVRRWFDRLQLRPDTRQVWAHALEVWGQGNRGG
jgi:hypothetical protein